MKLAVKIVDKINTILVGVAAALLAAGCLLAVVNALCRKFLSVGFPWAEELCTYFVVMMLFLSLPYLEQFDKHLCINILMSKLKGEKSKRLFRIIRGIWTILIMGIMLRYGFVLAKNMYLTNITTYVLRLPRVIFFSTMLLGFTLIIAVWLCVIICRKGRGFDAD